jgi:Autotransporter beta-domain
MPMKATKTSPMKHLSTALLLAAASATQLDAAIYNLQWSGAAYGNAGTATGTMDLDLTNKNMTGFSFFNTNSGLNSASITISGTGTSRDGTWSVANGGITTIVFGANNHGADITQEMVAQGGGSFNGWLHFYNLSGTIVDPMSPMGAPGDITNIGAPLLKLTFLGLGTPPPQGPSGVSDFADWMSSVNNQHRTYNAGVTLASLPLEGAHHRPMMSFDRMGKDAQFWATGDFGSSSRVRDVKVTSGEVGVNKDIGPNTLAGFAVGRGQQNQDLALDGSNNVVGNYFLGEIDYRPFGSQWIVSLLGMVGSWDAKINRGYDNGGSTDYSLGQTDIATRSARLRVDAPVLFSVAGFGFSPYASYAVTQTTVAAYTENGGGLPASYDEQEHNATEARLGMMATNVLNAKTKLIISVEGIHRFDGAGPALTGQDITGSVGFSLPGQAPRPDCVRLGVDVDYKLAADTLLNVSAHASTVGEVADVSGAISIRRAF